MCSVSVLFLCLFPSCRAISRLERNRLLTSKKRLGRWEVFVFSCQKHSTELVWKASPLLVALLVKTFKEQRWLQGFVSPSMHLKSSPSAVAYLSCYQYPSERTLILFLLLLLLFLLFFIYNVETSSLTSWVFCEGECSQSLLVLCRSPALFFWGSVLRICVQISVLLLSWLLRGSGSAAASLENINACKHFFLKALHLPACTLLYSHKSD